MKTRVAVFDFSAQDCIATAEAVRQYFDVVGAEAGVEEFTSLATFAYTFKARLDSGLLYHMAFVGVDDMMGVETARNIRELDRFIPLFLVSRGSDYGLEGFRLHALDYITKPVSSERVGKAVERIGMKCLPWQKW